MVDWAFRGGRRRPVGQTCPKLVSVFGVSSERRRVRAIDEGHYCTARRRRVWSTVRVRRVTRVTRVWRVWSWWREGAAWWWEGRSNSIVRIVLRVVQKTMAFLRASSLIRNDVMLWGCVHKVEVCMAKSARPVNHDRSRGTKYLVLGH